MSLYINCSFYFKREISSASTSTLKQSTVFAKKTGHMHREGLRTIYVCRFQFHSTVDPQLSESQLSEPSVIQTLL